MFEVRIGGELANVRPTSLQIVDPIERRSRAGFVVLDRTGHHFTKGEPVEVTVDGAVVFAGFVEKPVERRLISDGLVEHSIDAIDNHYLAGRRLAARSYLDTAAGDIVRDLHVRYLAEEGIGLGIVEDGPVLVAAVFNYAHVNAVLDELAERAGFTWFIDHQRQLHFRSRDTVVAPWTVTGEDIVGRPTVERSNPQYRNRQYIRGGRDVTDPQVEQRQGDGKTRAWPMAYPLAAVPTVTVNGVAKTVGIRGVEQGKDWYWNKGDANVSQSEDVAPLPATDTLEVTYRGEFAIVALAEDPGEVTSRQVIEGVGTGFVEAVEEDASLTSRDAAFESAKAKLARYATVGRTMEFTTRRSGLAAGQLVTIDLPVHGVDEVQALIEQVVVTADNAGGVWFEVKAVEGPVTGSWTKFFERLSKRTSVVDLVNVGGGDVLALLTSIVERARWTETFTPTVHACPVPSPNLFPAADLFPC